MFKLLKSNVFIQTPVPAIAALVVTFLLCSGGAAWADSSTLGGIFCTIYPNVKPFGMLFAWIAYGAGAVFVVQGIHHLRLHTDNASNNPLHRALMLWFGAACLMALPDFIGTIVGSLYTQQTAGGTLACTGGSSGNGGAGLDGMMTGFISNIKDPLISIISLIAILCGLYMIVRGLMKASKYGFDPKTNSIHSVLTHIGFGALLMTIGDNLNMMMTSVFGTSSVTSAIDWTTVGSMGASQSFSDAINAGLEFVQIIGAIAFVRGWLILKKVVEGGGGNVTLAQGLTHILGGVVAINIFAFLKVMDATFGTGLLN
ncbi:MAG: hypothetical protein P4M13_00365 [Alphaproteobacteria bacterium]|nr:hypothetical protein [Alphaproteobacteria bacterium]